MRLNSRFVSTITIVIFCAVALAPAMVAQTQACVSLLVGAGYAAQMQVCQGTPGGLNLCQSWTGTFPIGQTRCQPLVMAVGQSFYVNNHAWWGDTVVCSPAPQTRSDFSGSVTFQAWGTTLSPKCQMPASDAPDAQMKASSAPSAEGRASERRLKSGKKPPPDVAAKEKALQEKK